MAHAAVREASTLARHPLRVSPIGASVVVAVAPLAHAGSAMERDPTEVDERDPVTTTMLQHMIAGSFAGVSEHALMFPVDTVKTMVQAGGGRAPRPGESAVVGGTSARLAVVRELVAKDGVGVLWRGIGVVPVGCVPAHAMMFSAYEVILEAGGSRKQTASPERVAAVGAVACGTATLFHDAIMVPTETVKQRLQLGCACRPARPLPRTTTTRCARPAEMCAHSCVLAARQTTEMRGIASSGSWPREAPPFTAACPRPSR